MCLGTDMVYYCWNLQFLNNVIIIKTKVLPSQALVTLAEFGYSGYTLWFITPNNFKLFDFPIVRVPDEGFVWNESWALN